MEDTKRIIKKDGCENCEGSYEQQHNKSPEYQEVGDGTAFLFLTAVEIPVAHDSADNPDES